MGKDFTQAVFLEIFCGTAGLSAAFKKKGFSNCISIDKIIPKLPKATVTKLDLTQRAHQLLVLGWIESPQVEAVFLAPPCGTASMARNIEVPDEPDAPAPLRSHLQPDGLDNLEGLDFIRVEQANILYSFAAECFDLCTRLGKPCMLENPSNSLALILYP